MRINASNFNATAFNVKSQNKINTTSRKADEGVNVHAQKTADDKNTKGGGLQDTLKAISERRQQIIENKNELITQTLESGGKLTDIAEPLKMYEQQLKNLDKERRLAIAKEAEESKKIKEAEKTDKTQKVEAPKTEEEAQAEKINKTAEKISRFDSVEGSLSMAESMKSRVKILEGEIKLDEGYRGDFERSVAETATRHTAALMDPDSSSKEKEIERLSINIEKLNKSTPEVLKKVNSEVAAEVKVETRSKSIQDKNRDVSPDTNSKEENTVEEIDTYA